MDKLWQDLRFSLRTLLKRPGFTVVAMLTLGLGIGANTAIFTVVNGVLLRPLPYPEPDRLVQVHDIDARQNISESNVSPANFADWRDQNRVFESIAAYRTSGFDLTAADPPERLPGAAVSASFFSVLGVKPALGRTFSAEEDQPAGAHLIVISHALWQRRFGGEANIIGRTLLLNSGQCTVIGVMPPEFKFPEQAQLWAPIAFSLAELSQRGSHYNWAIARLKPGIPLDQAQADMNAIARHLEQQYPETNKGRGVRLVLLHEQLVGPVRLALLVLLGAVGLVLLIACANVANLTLARAASRYREIAIRLALGARRWRIIRQLLTESLMLSLVGGALGVALAFWTNDLLQSILPADLPRRSEIRTDFAVLGFAFLISALTGVLFGVMPAFQGSNLNLIESLKEGGRLSVAGSLRRWTRQVFVVCEVALALVLVIGSGLMIKSLLRLQSVDPGFNPENVLTGQLNLPAARYSDPSQQINFYQQVLQRTQTLPGVQAAGLVTTLPMSGANIILTLGIEGRPPAPPGQRPRTGYNAVSPDYFRAMGTPLRHGRFFTDRDARDAAPVVIVNESFVWEFFPSEDPIGKHIIIGYGTPVPRQIVGVVGDVRHFGLDIDTRPEVYTPYQQISWSFMTLVVRAASNPRGLVRTLQHQIRSVDKDQVLSRVRLMEELVSESVAAPRFRTLLVGLFAGLALVLAAIGVYGVMAYAVTQRTHEIGIRMALGADRRTVMMLILRQATLLTLTGIGIGLAGAWALARLISDLLFGVGANDPLTFVGVPLLLMGVALGASLIPAYRATKVDPMVALRYE
jgi:putative ABC transport system permease protein